MVQNQKWPQMNSRQKLSPRTFQCHFKNCFLCVSHFRMKEENQPIKLECFLQMSESKREEIGFVLIPLRTIPFWNGRKMGMMKPHWYKLHGVTQDNKTQKPEILLSVTIGDKDEIQNGHEKLVGVISCMETIVSNIWQPNIQIAFLVNKPRTRS